MKMSIIILLHSGLKELLYKYPEIDEVKVIFSQVLEKNQRMKTIKEIQYKSLRCLKDYWLVMGLLIKLYNYIRFLIQQSGIPDFLLTFYPSHVFLYHPLNSVKH